MQVYFGYKQVYQCKVYTSIPRISLAFIRQHLENNAKQRASRYSNRSTLHLTLTQFNDEETMAKMETTVFH